jgi:hypothetical protein
VEAERWTEAFVWEQPAMTKRTWTVHVAGYPDFQMVLLDGELNADEAQIAARLIWPLANVS